MTSRKSDPVSASPTLDFQNPWPGLAAYDEASRDFFHGRREEALEFARLVRASPLTAVYGKSGLGKSSLLQAGLFPLARAEHYLPVLVRLDIGNVVADEPLAQVRRRLEVELVRLRADYPAFEDGESLWAWLHRKDRELWSSDNFPLTPLFVFDQFEELFSRGGGNPEVVQAVFDDLADLIENRIPAELATDSAAAKRARLDLFSQRYRVVLSFREDFLPDLKSWEKKVPSLLRNYLRLDPMSRACAIEAVERAGKAVIEPGVAPAIVDFVGRQDEGALRASAEPAIEPVLLSLCCAQLNRRRVEGKKIDLELLRVAGQDILDAFYRDALLDEAVAGPPDVASFIEEFLIQGDHFRGDYPRDEAIAKGLLTLAQLKALTDQHRLLRVVPQLDTARIELIHDRMVPVVRAARDERQTKRKQEALERAAATERQRAEERDQAAKGLARALSRARIFAACAIVLALTAAFFLWQVAQQKQVARDQAKVAEGLRERADRQAALAWFRALSVAALNQSELDPELGVVLARKALEQANAHGDAARREAVDTLGRSLDALRVRSKQSLASSANAFSFSADLSLVAVTQSDWTLRLMTWPAAKQAELPEAWGATRWPSTFSPTGNLLAASIDDGQLRIWNTTTKKVVTTLTVPGQPVALAFSRDAKLLAVGGEYSAWLFRVGETAPFRTLAGHLSEHGQFVVNCLAFSPDSSLLATGAGDKAVRVWDVQSGAERATLRGHTAEITSVEFSADGKELLSASEDASARLWNLAQKKARLALLGHANTVFVASFSDDGTKISTASADSTVRIWDVASGRQLLRLIGHSNPVSFARFTENDRSLVSASWDGVVRTWDVSGHTGRTEALQFSPNGSIVATAGSDGTVRIWSAPTGEELRVLTQHRAPIVELAFDEQGTRLASADVAGCIQLWDPATGAATSLARCESDGIQELVFSSDGSRLLTAAGAAGVALWSVRDGSLERRLLPDHTASAKKVASSPDGAWIAAATDDGKVWFWSSARPDIRRSAPAHQGRIYGLAFSPDSRTLASASHDARVRLWDVESGEPRLAPLLHDDAVMHAVFMPDGKRLLTSTLRGTLYVWDTQTAKRLQGPLPHQGLAMLRLTKDGTRLATYSWDRRAKVWDTTSWKELATLTHRELVDVGDISPDGTIIATATPYDGLRIVPLDSAALERLAQKRVTRTFTLDECNTYLRPTDCPLAASSP